MKKKLFATGALVVVLTLGYAVSVAVAEKPPAPPGQGECGHGNTDKPCKTDPSTNGKDCEAHGPKNGGENEDHCLTTSSPTTSSTNQTSTGETTTSQTTTTSPTSSTSPTTSTGTSTPGSTSTPTAPTTSTPTPTTSTTGSTTTSTPTPGTTPTPPEGGTTPPKVEPKTKTGHRRSGPKPQLPFTGAPLPLIATLAALALLFGLIARRKTR